MKDDRAVEQPLVDAERSAYDQHGGDRAALLEQAAERRVDGVEQRVLVEEILA